MRRFNIFIDDEEKPPTIVWLGRATLVGLTVGATCAVHIVREAGFWWT